MTNAYAGFVPRYGANCARIQAANAKCDLVAPDSFRILVYVPIETLNQGIGERSPCSGRQIQRLRKQFSCIVGHI